MDEKIDSHVQNGRFLAETYRRALVPGVLSILGGNINILADGIIVGQKLGSNGLSAVSLCLPLYLIICVFGSWMVAGTAINSAKALGAGNEQEGDRFCRQSLFLCLAVSVIMTLLGGVFLNPIVSLLCSEDSLRPLVYAYALTNVIGVLPKVLIYIPFWYLRLDGKNRSITVMMILMGGGNVILDLVLMYGFELGIFGAGMASVISTAVAVIFGFWSLYGRRRNFTLGLDRPRSGEEFRSIISAGSPSALNNVFQTFRVLTINTLLMAAGGSPMVAVFTACNGVAAFAECILSGIPQAASAMLGSFAGDGDNSSIRLIIKHQIKSGLGLSLIFSVLIIAGADLISAAYGLNVPFHVPMICLAASLAPGLVCTVVIGYYNTADMNRWANIIVFGRVFLFPALFLFLLMMSSLPIWLFIPLGELATALVWALTFFLRYHRDQNRSCYLRLPTHTDEKQISSSVEGASEDICDLSEGMLDFCTDNGMSMDLAMKISLAIEELLVLVSQENQGRNLFCDLRLKIPAEGAVMTLRYSGKDFNPLPKAEEDDMEYLGMKMLKKMTKKADYQNISGMNVLRITV